MLTKNYSLNERRLNLWDFCSYAILTSSSMTYSLTYLLTDSLNQSLCHAVRETPYDGVCSCAGLDVQDIQRS